MNPDIQRIAEKAVNKIYAECDEFWHDIPCRHRPKMEEIIGAILTELSALRDTQERERKEGQDTIKNRLRDNVRELHKEITSLRAELARRDEVEKELREKVRQCEIMEQDDSFLSSVPYRKLCKIWDRVIDRIPGLSRKLSLGAFDELAEHLGIRPRDWNSDEYVVIKEEELKSLRSRIGELEAQVEDARNQWLERDT